MPVMRVPVNMVTDDLGDQTHRQGSSKPLRLGVSLVVIFKICRCRRHLSPLMGSCLVEGHELTKLYRRPQGLSRIGTGALRSGRGRKTASDERTKQTDSLTCTLV